MVSSETKGQQPEQEIFEQNEACGGEENRAGGDANVAGEGAAAGDNTAGVAGADAAAEWRDKYMRLSAEFDNYRKRTLREKLDLVEMGGEKVISAMLPVLDDMDRALDAVKTSDDAAAVRQGVELIAHKLRETLRGQGLSEIECLGSELDTDLHEAVARIPAGKKNERGRILDTAQKGYKLKDKVIRHAKVVVGE